MRRKARRKREAKQAAHRETLVRTANNRARKLLEAGFVCVPRQWSVVLVGAGFGEMHATWFCAAHPTAKLPARLESRCWVRKEDFEAAKSLATLALEDMERETRATIDAVLNNIKFIRRII